MPVADLGAVPVLGHLDLVGQRRAAERAQADRDHLVPLDPRSAGDRAGGVELAGASLAVVDRQCVHRPALGLRDREHGGRVESAAEKDDRGGIVQARHSSKPFVPSWAWKSNVPL